MRLTEDHVKYAYFQATNIQKKTDEIIRILTIELNKTLEMIERDASLNNKKYQDNSKN